MKKFLLLCVAATLTCSISFAKIWRVNNTAGIAADFTTAQAAHNGATAGDTIHLEPSINTYGSLTTTKSLVWISTGNFLASHPGLQYLSTPGRIEDLNVNPGSQNSVFSCNIGYGYANTSNITFMRCYITNNFLNISGNNCVVIGCYIDAYLSVSNATNIIINNNIIAQSIGVSANSSAVIVNNIMNIASSGGSNIYNSQFQNNIINQHTSTPYTFTNCNLNNNMANDVTLPAGNGNQNSVSMSTVFINYQGNTDGAFILAAGSPAIGTGYGGINMGAFSGSTPFALGLQPAVPAIYQINAPAAPSGNTMNVIFSTRSNN